MYLVIAEKPSVSKVIAEVIGASKKEERADKFAERQKEKAANHSCSSQL